MLAGGLHSGALQNVAQAWTGKAGSAHRAFAPLDAGDLRAMEAASVAGAFEGVDDGVSFEFGEFGQAQGEGLLDFSADGETPFVSIELGWFVHVIAHEEVRHGGEPGVEIFDWGFQIDEAVGAENHAVFAGEVDGLFLRESPGQEGWGGACGQGGG